MRVVLFDRLRIFWIRTVGYRWFRKKQQASSGKYSISREWHCLFQLSYVTFVKQTLTCCCSLVICYCPQHVINWVVLQTFQGQARPWKVCIWKTLRIYRTEIFIEIGSLCDAQWPVSKHWRHVCDIGQFIECFMVWWFWWWSRLKLNSEICIVTSK